MNVKVVYCLLSLLAVLLVVCARSAVGTAVEDHMCVHAQFFPAECSYIPGEGCHETEEWWANGVCVSFDPPQGTSWCIFPAGSTSVRGDEMYCDESCSVQTGDAVYVNCQDCSDFVTTM